MTLSARPAAKKNLRDGRSVWQDSVVGTIRATRLTKDATCDIAIVGAGISGALTALTLAADGYDVAILDRCRPGAGSTMASTALIQFEIDTPLTDLAEKIGRANAERAYRRSFQAVADLGSIIRRFNLPAHWRNRQSLYLAGNAMGFRGLQSEATARQRMKLPSQYLGRAEFGQQFGIDRTGAILSDGAAELDPARTCAGCLMTARRLGAQIYAPCEAIKFESHSKGLSVKTRGGPSVNCRKLVLATGYEVVDGISKGAFDIVSSWAMATGPVPSRELWPGRCLIWEAADPYLYMRTTHDNRILAGGEDSGLLDTDRRAAAIPNKTKSILRQVRELLQKPDLQVAYAWAGAFAESPTGLPVLRQLVDLPGAYAILGCGGNGITYSMIASQLVAQWVRGQTDPDAGLFAGRGNLTTERWNGY